MNIRNTYSLLLFLTLLFSSSCAAATALPRFMLMIDEKNMGTYSMGDTERVITQALMDRGADVVDSELIRTTVNRDKALQTMTGSPQAAAAIGLQFGADIILVGRAIAKGSADKIENTSFRSYSASINIKAIRTDTAEIISTDTSSVAKIHVDDVTGGSLALQAAAQQVADSLIPKLLAKYARADAGGITKIQLIVGNVTQIWQVAGLKKMLREQINGVQDVVQRSFVSGVAVFEVHFGGSSQKLAESLTLAKQKYFKIKVHGVSSRKLDAKLIETGS
jgi:hypothetical protein